HVQLHQQKGMISLSPPTICNSAALGQFERDLIRERTKAGLTAAAARGRKGGRKPVVTADKLQRAREHIANGLNVREAATRLKVSKTALYTALQSTSAADS
ncbi:recombinase family protein, partial [Shigella sonnei]|uniref:recombinase family protein n=1 Tax=Shigella sonnei TaxID=624 RepID=UPI00311CB425